MEDVAIVLERHEQKIKKLEEEFSDLRAVQEEIKSMNKALITLTAELKHTNEHLATSRICFLGVTEKILR